MGFAEGFAQGTSGMGLALKTAADQKREEQEAITRGLQNQMLQNQIAQQKRVQETGDALSEAMTVGIRNPAAITANDQDFEEADRRQQAAVLQQNADRAAGVPDADAKYEQATRGLKTPAAERPEWRAATPKELNAAAMRLAIANNDSAGIRSGMTEQQKLDTQERESAFLMNFKKQYEKATGPDATKEDIEALHAAVSPYANTFNSINGNPQHIYIDPKTHRVMVADKMGNNPATEVPLSEMMAHGLHMYRLSDAGTDHGAALDHMNAHRQQMLTNANAAREVNVKEATQSETVRHDKATEANQKLHISVLQDAYNGSPLSAETKQALGDVISQMEEAMKKGDMQKVQMLQAQGDMILSKEQIIGGRGKGIQFPRAPLGGKAASPRPKALEDALAALPPGASPAAVAELYNRFGIDPRQYGVADPTRTLLEAAAARRQAEAEAAQRHQELVNQIPTGR